MTSLARFADVRALLVGAGHGIGRACATRLAEEGARLVVADLDLDAATELVAGLPATPGGTSLALRLDVTDPSSVQEGVDGAAAALGGLDVLVVVAGGDTPHGTFEQTGDDVWQQMFDLNLLGVVRCCRAAVPHLRASGRGPAVVLTSSVNSLVALGSEPYSAAKAGLGSLTANLAASLGADGIRVNAVAPATIRTRNWDGQEGGADRMRSWYPLGRVGEPSDVAGAVAFLASSDAGWVTGHTLPVDGGLLTGWRSP